MEVKFYDADTHLEVDPMSIEDDVDIVVKAKDSITGGGTNAGLYGVGFQVIDVGVVIVDRIAHEFAITGLTTRI